MRCAALFLTAVGGQRPLLRELTFDHNHSVELHRTSCSKAELKEFHPKCEVARAPVNGVYNYSLPHTFVLRAAGVTPASHSMYRLSTQLIVHGAFWRSQMHTLCVSTDGANSRLFEELRFCSQEAGPFDAATWIFVPSPLPRIRSAALTSRGGLLSYTDRLRVLGRAASALAEIDVCALEPSVLSPHVTSLACRAESAGRVSVPTLMILLTKQKVINTNMLHDDWLPMALAFVNAAMTLPQPYTMVEVGNLCGGATVLFALLKKIFCPACVFLSVDPGDTRPHTPNNRPGRSSQAMENATCHFETLERVGLGSQVTFVDDFGGAVDPHLPVGFTYLDGGK